MFETLFEPVNINGICVPNRLVRSATYDGAADKYGRVTDRQIKLFEDLARGGVGLIISGIASVHPSGRISGFQLDFSTDDCIAGLRRLTKSVQRHGMRVAAQLFHAGGEGHAYQAYKGRRAVTPSPPKAPVEDPQGHRILTEADILEIIAAFGDGARRAREGGFDAVQIHGAHAYLFSQFLSPATNRRSDAWGGALEGRLRFHREVYRAVRAAVGDDYPVMIKLGVEDGFPGGLRLDEGQEAAAACANWGFDAIEVSQGLRGRYYGETEFRTGIHGRDREAYFGRWCRAVKDRVDLPVIMVGGLRSPEILDAAIHGGDADLVALCRPFIREPALIKRWRNGDGRPSTCISCNQCFEAIHKGPLHCVIDGQMAAG